MKKDVMKKDLFIAPSIYTLLLYLLINKEWKEGDFVLSDRIPLVIHDSLRKNSGCYVYSYMGFKRVSYLKRLWISNKEYFKYRNIFKNREYKRVWGNDDFTPSYLYRHQGMILVEDGNFNAETISFIKKRQIQHDVFLLPYWFHWIFKNYTTYGWSKEVKTIWHTPSVQLPEPIRYKGLLFTIEDLWSNKSKEDQLDILKVFGINQDFIDNVNDFQTVLITQDLPIPDEDKIHIYKQMTEGMDMSKVLIKTHYAETTDYASVFPEATVIKMPVPMQLFALIGYEPKKIMTISSSAVAPFIKEGVDLVFLGTEIDSRIAAKYGIMTKETYMSKLNK